MILELNNEEVEILKVLIQSRIAAIGPEIHHTDTFDYRDFLKERRDVLTRMLERLTQRVA